jgi:hypothetical protein
MQATPNPASPAPAEPTVADTLRHAARYLQRHGWHKGAFYLEPSGAFPPACAAGAIRIAVCGRPVRLDDDELTLDDRCRIAAAETALADHLGYYPMHEDEAPAVLIGTWNDEDWRTAADVITELNHAAAALDRDHATATHGGAQ